VRGARTDVEAAPLIGYYLAMLVLALDTTTRQGSCALVRGQDVLLERTSDASQPPASRLPGELMTLLDAAGVTLPEVDVYAVATGPGSFTGLRVGIATMQGLAFAAGKPLLGVSAFDALAVLARASAGARVIAPWVDAWRGEVYAAVYQDGAPVDPPVVAHPDQLLERLRGHAVTFVGDGAATYRTQILAASSIDVTLADPLTPPLAGTLGRLAASAAAAGELPPPHAIRPLYVRRPDPELARDARLAG
jgi:tRNA threonylcarbamoyladenosine biosynthesis protein TsaB